MSDLIHAEWFILKKSGSDLKLIIYSCILSVFFSYIDGILQFNRHALANAAIMGIIICSMIAALITGKHFRTRTAYYEIMDGYSPHAIILSKLIVFGAIIITLWYLPVSVILLVSDGGGDAPLFLLMLLLTLIKYFVIGLSCTLFLKADAGIALMLPRIMLEALAAALADTQVISESTAEWFALCQFGMMSETVPSQIIPKIIIGFIVECTLMYILAYMSYKKKWNININLF